MLTGKLKYVLLSIFLLVFIVLVAEAGYYFGATGKGRSTFSSLSSKAPLIIDQDRLAGFEFVKRSVVKGITIEVQFEGTITKIKGPDWFSLEKDGETMYYKVFPEEPPLEYLLFKENKIFPASRQDVMVGDKVTMDVSYDNETGMIISHSLTIIP